MQKYRQPTKAIITDAGYASRYLPIAKTIPKAMLPLGNRPPIWVTIGNLLETDEYPIGRLQPDGRVENLYKTDFTKEQILINLNENHFKQSIPIPNFIIFLSGFSFVYFATFFAIVEKR